MSEDEVSQILAGKVSVVSESTEKEKELFSDKTEKGFFTFSLTSGQKFVACFSKDKEEQKRTIAFRPLNRLIKGLEEFSWKIPNGMLLYTNSEFNIKFSDEISGENKNIIKEFLFPTDRSSTKTCYPYPLLEKAISISDAYFNVVHAQRQLMKKLISERIQKQI